MILIDVIIFFYLNMHDYNYYYFKNKYIQINLYECIDFGGFNQNH